MTEETYPTDSTYLQTFQDENGPVDMTLTAMSRFKRPPLIDGARVLELGCGHGVSLAVRAAIHPKATFHGIDIIPEHIAIGRTHAADAGLENLTFEVGDISALADIAPPGGAYDMIILHGVWSWVGDATRRALVRLLAGWAAPGALINISYDCYPFWNLMEPLRYVLRELLIHGPGQHDMKRVREITEAFLESDGSEYTRGMWDRMKGMPDRFLIHEFMSQDARPFWPQDVAHALAPAGLTPMGQVPLERNIPGLIHDKDALALIKMGREQGFPKTAEDLASNKSFRSDVMSKGAPALKEPTAARLLADWRVFKGSPDEKEIENPKFPGMAEAVSGIRDGARADEVIATMGEQSGGVGLQPFLLTLALEHLEVFPPVSPEARASMMRFNALAVRSGREGTVLPCMICVKRGRPVRLSPDVAKKIAMGEALDATEEAALAPFDLSTGEPA